MEPAIRTNERILSGLFSSVQVKNQLTQNHQQMHVNNPSISLRDFHLHTNLSKIPPFNITNIIDRPMFFLFKSNSIIQDFVLLFISFMIILLFLLLVLVLYRRYTKSLLANEISF